MVCISATLILCLLENSFESPRIVHYYEKKRFLFERDLSRYGQGRLFEDSRHGFCLNVCAVKGKGNSRRGPIVM